MLKIHRLIAIATLILGITGSSLQARASTIQFNFAATLQTGNFAGTAFTGTASYDNSGVTGIGMEYISLKSLDFSVLGETFSRAGISQGGQVILQDGAISYFTAAYFPSSGPLDDLAFGFGGPGIIGYSVPPGFNAGSGTYTILASVPEPSTILLFSAAILALPVLGAQRKATLHRKA